MAAGRAAGLREKKKELTRRTLIESAFRLFTKRGFDRTTVDDIVADLAVSRRTFFRYFASKEDVAVGWFVQVEIELLEVLRSRPQSETAFEALQEALACSVNAYTEQKQRMRQLVRLFAETPSIRALYHAREHLLEERCAAEVAPRLAGSPDMRRFAARVVTGAAFGAKRAAFETWADGGFRGDLAALTAEAFGMFAPKTSVVPARPRGAGPAVRKKTAPRRARPHRER